MADDRASTTPPRERAHHWLAPELGDMELLRATFLTHSFAPHAHDTYAIGVVERGAETFHCDGRPYVAPAGSLILINPGVVHTGQASTPEGWSYRMLYPAAEPVRAAASAVAGRERPLPDFAVPVVEDPELAADLRAVHAGFEAPASALERQSQLLWLLARLVARHAAVLLTPPRVGRERGAVARAREYLEAHVARNVSLDELASVAGLSPFHLVRIFRAHVGLPPHRYQVQVRVARAKRLLAAGLAPALVAAETGFADQSHLSRHFKRLVGVPPGHYGAGRKNVQDAPAASP